MGDRKHCRVAYALPARQFLWDVEVPADATVAQVLEAARLQAATREEEGLVPWESETIGIFGEPCRRQDIPRDADRVEIYRSLTHDPRASRRARVRR